MALLSPSRQRKAAPGLQSSLLRPFLKLLGARNMYVFLLLVVPPLLRMVMMAGRGQSGSSEFEIDLPQAAITRPAAGRGHAHLPRRRAPPDRGADDGGEAVEEHEEEGAAGPEPKKLTRAEQALLRKRAKQQQGAASEPRHLSAEERVEQRRQAFCRGDGVAGVKPAERAVWEELRRERMHFRLAGALYSNSTGGHGARMPLLLHKQQFARFNSRGIPAGYAPYVAVRPKEGLNLNFPERHYHFHEDLMTVLPQRDRWWKYRTCAVVGNSGRLLHAKHGAAIDAHDAVIRINYAPTQGYEAHVGSKTTFDVVNQVHARAFTEGAGEQGGGEGQQGGSGGGGADGVHGGAGAGAEDGAEDGDVGGAGDGGDGDGDGEGGGEALHHHHHQQLPTSKRSEPRNTTLVLFEVTVRNSRDRLYAALMKLMNRSKKEYDGVAILSPELVVHFQWIWNNMRRLMQRENHIRYQLKAMSGFYASMFALQTCEHVDVYGMSPYLETEGHWHGKYHYMDDVVATTAAHSFDLGWEILDTISRWPCAGVKLTTVKDE